MDMKRLLSVLYALCTLFCYTSTTCLNQQQPSLLTTRSQLHNISYAKTAAYITLPLIAITGIALTIWHYAHKYYEKQKEEEISTESIQTAIIEFVALKNNIKALKKATYLTPEDKKTLDEQMNSESNETLKLCNKLLKEPKIHSALIQRSDASADSEGYQITIKKGKIVKLLSIKSNTALSQEDCDSLQFLWNTEQQYKSSFLEQEQRKIYLFQKIVERLRPQRGSISKSETNIRDARCRAAKIMHTYTEYKFQKEQFNSSDPLATEHETIKKSYNQAIAILNEAIKTKFDNISALEEFEKLHTTPYT